MNKLRVVIDTNILVSSILINLSMLDLAFKKAKNLGIILFSSKQFGNCQGCEQLNLSLGR